MRDEELPVPGSVEIEPADGAFFLLYLDARGRCQADTWHATVEDAKAQAAHEFGIEPDEWDEVADPRTTRA